MQQKALGRFLVVLGAVLLAIYYVLPSARLISYRVTHQPPQDPESPEYTSYTERIRVLENSSLPFGATPLRFGLDLQGGADIVLALDQKATVRQRLTDKQRDLRRLLQRENVDATLEVDEARQALVISLRRAEDERVANTILENPDYEYLQIFEEWEKSAFAENRPVILRLRPRVITNFWAEAIDSALLVIRNRVDALGLTQPVVVRQGPTAIRVQMPGERRPEDVVKNIIKPAQLEFRLLHKDSDAEIAKLFTEADYQKVCEYIGLRKEIPDPLPLKPGIDIPAGYTLRPGQYSERKSARQSGEPVIRYKPHLVRNNVDMTGENLRNAWSYLNQQNLTSPWEIHLAFNNRGAIEFRDLTTQHVGEQLAIVLDNYLYSAPVIKTAIPDGRAVIEGSFTQQEARDLSLVLKAGALPATLEPIQEWVVGATLGADSIQKGINALIIGGIAVIIFMIGYYGTSGFIAVIALAINVLCVVAIMCLSRATLTLSGIGGLLLTMGMAVDANVLIYERIREEKATSRGLKAAISKGFARAFMVIFDSNTTTLIAALVLLQFGTGSVQGFALTMTFGIFTTMFTGFFVTHVLTDLWVQKRESLGVGKIVLFKNPKFDFIRLRYAGYAISAILLVVGIGAMIARGGPQFGVEFTGGVMADVSFSRATSEDEIKVALGSTFASPIVQRVSGNTNRFLLRVKTAGQGPQETESVLRELLNQQYGANVATIGSASGISDEVGGAFIRKALVAVLISCIGILIYLWFRFEMIFGAGAVIALVHDTLVTLGLCFVFNQEISLNVVAALLIVIGYSVNDTIVIFDRIREVVRTMYGLSYPDMLNLSINQSLNRTVVTGMSALTTMIVMMIFGGPGLRDMGLVLTIGTIVGTYSSSFIATPVVYEYHEYRRRRQAELSSLQRAAAVR